MSFNWEHIGDKVYGILSEQGYGLLMQDENGKATMDPHNAVRFLATIKSKDPNLESFNVLIGLHDEDAYSHLDFRTPKTVGDADFDTITNLKNSIQKNLGDVEGLKINWTPFGSAITLKDDPIKKISESKDISKVYGTTKSSFQRVGGSKMIIRHSDPIDESKQGSRWRKIHAVFVETKEGERFKYPHGHIAGARAFARHLSEGGRPQDAIGRGIMRMSEDYMDLKRAKKLLARSGKHDDAANVRDAMHRINHDLKRTSGPRGYKSAKDMITSYGNHDKDAAGKMSKQLLTDCECADDGDSKAIDTAAKYVISVQLKPEQAQSDIPQWLAPMLKTLSAKLSDPESIAKLADITSDVDAGNMPAPEHIRFVTDLAKTANSEPAADPALARIKQLSGI